MELRIFEIILIVITSSLISWLATWLSMKYSMKVVLQNVENSHFEIEEYKQKLNECQKYLHDASEKAHKTATEIQNTIKIAVEAERKRLAAVETIKEPCGDCGGTGKIRGSNDRAKKCSWCEGEGSLLKTVYKD